MSKSSFGFFALALLTMSNSATAAIFTETGDAGQTLLSAQTVTTFPTATSLDAIRGNLEANGADLFKIFLTGGQAFSATTSASSLAFNDFDSQLFLFNSSGLGVYANDDDTNSPPQSTLPASISLTPAASGIYYLAISGSGYLPLSSGGFIFPVSGGLLDQSGGGASGAVGPTGPGGASPLSGWSSSSGETGGYEIKLTGAQFFTTVSDVPEPGSILLMAVGLCGIGWRHRRLALSRFNN